MDRARKPDPVDVVIVGTGATGGTAAKVLSERGLKVVGLDRGPWLKPKDFSGDEIKYVNRSFLVPDPLLNPRTYRQDESKTAELSAFSLLPQMVGGGTVHWAGWFPRPLPSDFIQYSLHGDVAGANLADWPYRYDDLEPFLTKVEWAFGCAGLDGADKYCPPRSGPYPTPPAPPTRFGKAFYGACEKLGINAHPIPQAFVTKPFNGREPTNFTGFWNLYGDPSRMRSGTATTFIPEALATGNYELRTESYVTRITLNEQGEAKGVVYLDEAGREVEQEAKIVILGAGAIESARLLFLSSSARFPDGLTNRSGLLGRNATFHEYLYSVGLFDRRVADPLNGYAGHYLSGGSMQFYETDETRGHICGSIIGASQVGQPIAWHLPGRPMWGEAAKDADREFFLHAMKIGVCLHDLAVETNRVDLDPTVQDAWGLPAARITHKSHPNDLALARWQLAKNTEILDAAGASRVVSVRHEHCTGNTFHQHGTARMGFDPRRSVLNEWCEAHDVPNLYVIDGSGFPTALGVNPTLTMMAHGWRACEFIADHHANGRKLRLDPPGAGMRHSGRVPDMANRSEWLSAPRSINKEPDTPLFFAAHEWATVEAATARLYPSDHEPGAREAWAVRFIDRYLSGLDYIFASADGSGFLEISGRAADVWRARIGRLQQAYRAGIRRMDAIAHAEFQRDFQSLADLQQDRVLEILSGAPKPSGIAVSEHGETHVQNVSDDGLSFFEALALHTRQGMFCDPVYGGNRDRVGWSMIRFPGPNSLAETQDGSYSHRDKFLTEYNWAELIPHLRHAD